MTLRRVSLELTVERPTPGYEDQPPGVARLSARFESSGDREPTTEELADALVALDRDLLAALRHPPRVDRPDRPVEELIETYRPRQAELVELLRADGEISDGEYALLRSRFKGEARAGPVGEADAAATSQSLAAMPLVNDHTPAAPRPVAELLDKFEIRTLKQAGAVRARRQISFTEYMSLKRHFGSGVETDSPSSPPP